MKRTSLARMMPVLLLAWLLASLSSPAAAAGAVAPPPPNDAWAAAALLNGSSGTVAGNNTGATIEQGWESNVVGTRAGASVWYRWSGSGGGAVTFDTTGSTFDTILIVWVHDGTRWSDMAEDDNSAGFRASRIERAVVDGSTYYVGLYGAADAAGYYRLNWRSGLPPTPVTTARPPTPSPTSMPPVDLTGDLGSSNPNPGTVADVTGSSGTPAAGCMFITAGNDRSIDLAYTAPDWLRVCPEGFKSGAVLVQLTRPNGTKYPAQNIRQGPLGLLFALPSDAANGAYTLTVSQGQLHGSLKFLVDNLTPRIVLAIRPMTLDFWFDPEVRKGQVIYLYLTGFPRNAAVRLNVYREVKCASTGGLARTCYHFWRTYPVRAGADGRGEYRLRTRSSDPTDGYMIVADHPNVTSQRDPRASFTLKP